MDETILMLSRLLKTILFTVATMSSFTNASANERMKVLTTFTVLADMAANVAGDAADVVSITKPGAEIHGYEPTPQDIVRGSNADLILWNGMNLELWFKQFLGNMKSVPSVVLTDGINPISISSGNYQGKPNPHAWMGLDNAIIYIDNIRDAFVDHDPKNAQTYNKNAKNYKNELRSTIMPLRKAINDIPLERRWLVTCEGAFSYLAQDFKMKELYLWPMNADQVGTPKQIRTVIDGIRKNNINVIFCESTVNTAPAKQVARETDAKYGGVLYVDSLSKANGEVPTYLDLLTVTSQRILEGLNSNIN